jgi:hypothetical protein
VRLTKKQVERLGELQDALQYERAAISGEFQRTRVALHAAVQDYNIMVERHNRSLARAREFVETVAAELRDAVDEKSDKWKDSDAGQAAEGMVEEWENARLEDVELLQVLEPDPPHFEESLNLPEEDA